MSISAKTIHIPVAALLGCEQISDNPWLNKSWYGVGVIPYDESEQAADDKILIAAYRDTYTYQFNGFTLELHHDELESYYQNLSGACARIFIVCRQNDDDDPIPFLITLSYDEAAVYMETDEIVFSTNIDIYIYQQVEQFLLKYYQPPKRKKRQRVSGSAGQQYQHDR